MKKLKDLLREDFVSETHNEMSITPSEKKEFLHNISNYNKYGESISTEHDLVEIAKELSKMAHQAEIIVLSNADDSFDKVTISRNFKSLKALSGQFNDVAKDIKILQQRLIALFDEQGQILGRYFEINDQINNK